MRLVEDGYIPVFRYILKVDSDYGFRSFDPFCLLVFIWNTGSFVVFEM